MEEIQKKIDIIDQNKEVECLGLMAMVDKHVEDNPEAPDPEYDLVELFENIPPPTPPVYYVGDKFYKAFKDIISKIYKNQKETVCVNKQEQ